MKELYELTYSNLTANNSRMCHTMVNLSREEAEDICKRVESLEGYRLEDLNRQF